MVKIFGFRQVSPDQDVRDYFTEGIQITERYIDTFASYTNDEDIYFTFTSDGDITDSTESPFSDKLIMFHVNTLSLAGIGMYGVSFWLF